MSSYLLTSKTHYIKLKDNTSLNSFKIKMKNYLLNNKNSTFFKNVNNLFYDEKKKLYHSIFLMQPNFGE